MAAVERVHVYTPSLPQEQPRLKALSKVSWATGLRIRKGILMSQRSESTEAPYAPALSQDPPLAATTSQEGQYNKQKIPPPVHPSLHHFHCLQPNT